MLDLIIVLKTLNQSCPQVLDLLDAHTRRPRQETEKNIPSQNGAVHATNYEIPCTHLPKYLAALLHSFLPTLDLASRFFSSDSGFFSSFFCCWCCWSTRVVCIGWPPRILRTLIERVQTFNNEIECNQAKDIENVPQRRIKRCNEKHLICNANAVCITH